MKTIQAALSMYNVRGIKALREAAERAAGAAMIPNAALVEEAQAGPPEGRKLIQSVNDMLGRAIETCASVEKIYKGSEAAIGLAKALRLGWDVAKDAMS